MAIEYVSKSPISSKLIKKTPSSALMVHTFNHTSQETEAGHSL